MGLIDVDAVVALVICEYDFTGRLIAVDLWLPLVYVDPDLQRDCQLWMLWLHLV